MRPFTFRLANVLTIWQRREDAARADLLREQAAVQAATVRVGEAEAACTRARAEAATASPATDAMSDPRWHQNWILHLTAERERAHQEVTRCTALESAARAAWQRTRRDRRVLERLRDRARQRYDRDARRNDLKRMDEVAGRGVVSREGLRS